MPDVKDLLKGAEENVSLAEYTSFKIGGPAKYFYAAKTAWDIRRAVQIAKELNLAYYIIGGGNNILVSDQGFGGLVIRIMNSEFRIADCEIFADAGINLGKLVIDSMNGGLTGLEWLIGIPGTLGGAIYGNAGAFGHSIGEAVESVRVFNPDNLAEEVLTGEDCEFVYRSSAFKKKKYIILSAGLKLKKGDKAESEKIIKDYIRKRGHHPFGFPSAGSVFKNVVIAENKKVFENLRKKYPEMDKFQASGRIPAGWFVEELGLRGKKIDGAMIAKEHGNFILNASNAKAADVVILISLIKQKIRVNFGLQLEEEIQYMGF